MNPSVLLIVSIICNFGEWYVSNPVYAELPGPRLERRGNALAQTEAVPA